MGGRVLRRREYCQGTYTRAALKQSATDSTPRLRGRSSDHPSASVSTHRLTATTPTKPEAGISQYKPKLYGHQPSRQPNGATASRTRAMTDRTIAVPGPVLDKSMRTPAVNAAPTVGIRTPHFNLQG